MKKFVVSVSGANVLASEFHRLVDPELGEVVPCVSDTVGDRFCDFVVVADETQPHCEGTRLDLHNFILRHYNFEIYRALASLKTIHVTTRCFVTGLSYAEVGIDVNELPFAAVNLAVSSQDLFYDFEFAKYLLSTNDFASNIRYALVGLAHYSLEYDLSRSSLGSRTLMYYPFFNTLHHFIGDVGHIKEFDTFEEQATKIFRADYLTVLYEILRKQDESWWPRMVNGRVNDRKIRVAEEQAKQDSAKEYPVTVRENVQILTDYIEFLRERNVEPILFVCPTLGYYYKYFSDRLTNEFLDIINHICDRYDLHLVDCFNSNLFGDSDFYDATHLNTNGAKKFTKVLCDRIWGPGP